MSSTYDRSQWRNSTFVLPSNHKSSSGYRPDHRNLARRAQEGDTKDTLPPDRDLLEGLKSNVLSELSVPIAAHEDDDIRIKDCQFIGSYSWTNRESPTIIVPGTLRLLYAY